MNFNNLTSSIPSTGDVVYHEVSGMGIGKRRPCVVIAGSMREVFLIPLSSENWNPSVNPAIHFKGNISFAVLDRVFTVNVHECATACAHVSEGAIATCLKSLSAAVISGCLQ